MNYQVSISDYSIIEDITEFLKPAQMVEVNRVAGTSSIAALRTYHHEFDKKGEWMNPSLPTHGPGRVSSRFGESITGGWGINEARAEGVLIVNGMGLLAHKITGGVITPTKAKALTIPLIPEAHGVLARNYPAKLFRNPKETVLMETLENGEARPVYALRKSVTQKPIPGAMPPEDVYLNPFIDKLVEQLDKFLE